MTDYPFVPKSNAHLTPGQLWSIPLSDGRFACGLVLAIDRGASYGAKTQFVGGLVDWVGDAPPTAEAIHGRRVLEAGKAHVRVIACPNGGGVVDDDIAPAGLQPFVDGSIEGVRRRPLVLDQRGVEIVIEQVHPQDIRGLRGL